MVGLPTRVFDADIGTQLNFIIQQGDGVTPQDITGSTVTLVVENLGTFSPFVIDIPASGTCHYIIKGGDFPYGVYRAQLRILFDADHDFRTDIFLLNASKSL